MGLCKCPVRKVTNLFCYEHRVNVCENCLVANHPKCVVLSYLKWLEDGDYNPICELCSRNLNEEDCIRLICYHVFHWHCLNNYAEQLPATLAPAGYSCPSCKARIFPPPNLVSPVVDELRKLFETVNWGRTGLGLPLISEELVKKRKPMVENHVEQKSIDTVVHIDDQLDNVEKFENKYPDNVPRRLIHASENKRLLVQNFDRDDNKYGRRNINDKFGGRISSFFRRSKYFQFYSRNKYRRYVLICVFLFVVFFLLMMFLRKLGDGDDGIDDPMFNPMLNPNIHINDDDTR